MRTQVRTIIAAAAAAVSFASGASAAPFDARLVGADARFVVFVDLEAARQTGVGRALLARLTEDEGYAEFEQIMMDVAGFMPASDVTDVTIYADAYAAEPKAALVIRAAFDAAALRGGVGLAGGFRADPRGGREVLSWDDERTRKRVYACLFDARTILMASDPDTIGRAIDVLADPGRSLETNKTFPRPMNAAVDAVDANAATQQATVTQWVFVAGTDVAAAPAAAGNPVLSQAGDATLEVGEADGKTIARLSATAADAAGVEPLFNLANGLKALGTLAGRQRRGAAAPDEAALLVRELAGNTVVRRDGDAVTATLTVGNDRAVAIVDEVIARRAAPRADPAP